MYALLLSASLLSPSALAGGVNDTNVPYTSTFNFDWTGYVQGSTTFTFTPSAYQSNGLCTAFSAASGQDWCMTGTFSTGNSGQGAFATTLRRTGCGITTESFFLGYLQIQTQLCDLDQRLVAVYTYSSPVANPAMYDGDAAVGETYRTRFRTFNFSTWSYDPWSTWSGWDYDVVTAEDFVGSLSGPATGVFCEAPSICY
ncbi:MAG: hypothetical protein R3F61_24190 [Myxococcota bacterium]